MVTFFVIMLKFKVGGVGEKLMKNTCDRGLFSPAPKCKQKIIKLISKYTFTTKTGFYYTPHNPSNRRAHNTHIYAIAF